MKNILIIAFILISSVVFGQGQKISNYPAKTSWNNNDLFDCSSYKGIGNYKTEKFTLAQMKAEISGGTVTTDSVFVQYCSGCATVSGWKFSSDTIFIDTLGGGSVFVDTTSLSNRIDAKISYTDTTSLIATKYDIQNLTPIDTTNLSDSLRIAVNILNSKLDINATLPKATNPIYYVTVNDLGEWQIDTLLEFSKIIHQHIKSDSLTVNDIVYINGVQTYIHTETFLNTQGILLPAAKSGYGTVQLGNNVSTVDFSFDTNAVIKIRYSSGAGLTLTDTGTQVFITNTSGITDKIKLSIFLD